PNASVKNVTRTKPMTTGACRLRSRPLVGNRCSGSENKRKGLGQIPAADDGAVRPGHKSAARAYFSAGGRTAGREVAGVGGSAPTRATAKSGSPLARSGTAG